MYEALSEALLRHAAKTDTLLFLGSDARFMACKQGKGAIEVLEKAGVKFTALKDEPDSGAALDFLIGAADETKVRMKACAAVLDGYKTVVVYDPADAKAIKQLYPEYGVEVKAKVVTYTTYLAELIKSGALKVKNTGKAVLYQDPYQLSRDLGETEEARAVVSAYAELGEMLLNRKDTVWAGNILMAQYMPAVIKAVAERRIFNATSIGAKVIVTASVSEYTALKSAENGAVEILSIEDLILG
jgi:Fe-S oxidoreductase